MTHSLSGTAAAQRIEAHHAALVADLTGRVDQVLAGREGAIGQLARLVEDEILPHAQAEERHLYPVAAGQPGLGALVRAMVDEHRRIAELARAVQAEAGPRAAAAAYALRELFALHADKENRYLLPELAEAPGVDLGAALAAMEADLAGSPHEEVELDVRLLPHHQRHPTIFGLLERLRPGQVLVLRVDHDPLPLRYQLEALHGSAFAWEYRARGPEEWRIALRRQDDGHA